MESPLKELVDNFVAELQLLKTGGHIVRHPWIQGNEVRLFVNDSIPFSIIDLLEYMASSSSRVNVQIISESFPINLEILNDVKSLKNISIHSSATEYPDVIPIPNNLARIKFNLRSSDHEPVFLNFTNGSMLKWIELELSFPCTITMSKELDSLSIVHITSENERVSLVPSMNNKIRALILEKVQFDDNEVSRLGKLRKFQAQNSVLQSINHFVACREILTIEAVSTKIIDGIKPNIWDLPQLRYLDLTDSRSDNWKMEKIDMSRIILGVEMKNYRRFSYYSKVYNNYYIKNLFGSDNDTFNGSDYAIKIQPPNLYIDYYKPLPEIVRNKFQGIDSFGIKRAFVNLRGDATELKKLNNLGVGEVHIRLERRFEHRIPLPFLPKTQVIHISSAPPRGNLYIEGPDLPNLRMIVLPTKLEHVRLCEPLALSEKLVLKTQDSFVFTRIKNFDLVHSNENTSFKERYYQVQRTK